MQAITSLDDSQRQDLLQVLRTKTSTDKISEQLHASKRSQFTGSQYVQPKGFESLGSSSQILQSTPATVESKTLIERTRNELRIRVLSTHGDPHLCGLTEIELFDLTASRVILLPQNVIVRNTGKVGGNAGIQMSTKSLVNGQKLTTEHRNMWIGSLPLPQNPPVFLEIVVYFAKDT